MILHIFVDHIAILNITDKISSVDSMHLQQWTHTTNIASPLIVQWRFITARVGVADTMVIFVRGWSHRRRDTIEL